MILSTKQLSGIIGRKFRRTKQFSRKPAHPATRLFQVHFCSQPLLFSILHQALRIAVNDELKALEQTVPVLFGCLRPGGILCIISFHSLEDRIVKRAFLQAAGRLNSGSQDVRLIPLNSTDTVASQPARLGLVKTKRPVQPTKEEKQSNARSRSAKLRVFQKTT